MGMTAFLVVLDEDECVTLTSAEPHRSTAAVAKRPGTRHSVSIGAPGIAILSLLPDRLWPTSVPESRWAEVEGARKFGYATSSDEVIPGLSSVAVPLVLDGMEAAAIAVVYVTTDLDIAAMAKTLRDAAAEICEDLEGRDVGARSK